MCTFLALVGLGRPLLEMKASLQATGRSRSCRGWHASRFAATTALLTMHALPRPPLELPASTFGDLLWPRSLSSEAFRGLPLGDADGNRRSTVLTALVRAIDAQRHPAALFEQPARGGTRVDGRARSVRQAAYNWRRDGQRVACKSATLTFDQATDRWLCNFQKIKLIPDDGAEGGVEGATAAFDELLLALYTPRGLHVYRYKAEAHVLKGLRSSSTVTALKSYGAKGERSWAVALDESILPKVLFSHSPILPICHTPLFPDVTEIFSQSSPRNTSLSPSSGLRMSGSTRQSRRCQRASLPPPSVAYRSPI